MAIFKGTTNNDNLIGGASADDISGFAGDDTLSGDAGNDTLNGGAGYNTLDGGAGQDTAIFDYPFSDYSFSFYGSSIEVDYVPEYGYDTLTNVELLKFADGKTLSPNDVALMIDAATTAVDGTAATDTTDDSVDDTIAPDAPAIDAVAEDDVIDVTEAASEVTVTGSTEIGSTVSVVVNGGEAGEAAVFDDGSWSYTLPADMIVDGTLTIAAFAIDEAGNESEWSSKEVTVSMADVIPPEAPMIDVAGDKSGIVTDQDNADGVTITGTGEDGSTVQLSINGEIVDTNVEVVDGVWSYTATDLAHGEYEVYVTATDAAGNMSGEQTMSMTLIDTTAPDAPVIEPLNDTNSINLADKESGVTIKGTADADAEITLTFADYSTKSVNADSDGNWEYPLEDADYANISMLSATVTDEAGNTSLPGMEAFNVDLEVPEPTYSLSVDKTTVNEGAKAIFKLETENLSKGSVVSFDLSNSTISDADVKGGLSSTNYSFVIDANGKASLPISFLADKLTDTEDGSLENLTLTLLDDSSQSATVYVNDTSLSPKSKQVPHTGTVSIKGTAKQGEKLTADTTQLKDVNGLGAFQYQWLKNDLPIKGATSPTYTLTNSDVGKTVKVKVSYADGLKQTENETSVATKIVLSSKKLTPSYTLTVDNATANEDENDDASIATFTLTTKNVAADTKVNFTFSGAISDDDVLGGLPEAVFIVDKNGTASIPVSFIADNLTEDTEELTATLNNDASKTATVSVEDTSVFLETQTPHTGKVSIKGTPQQGETLSVVSTLADANTLGDFSYKWFDNGKEIKAATGTTYTLTKADVGKAIKVKVSYVDGLGKAENEISTATKLITAIKPQIQTPHTGNVSIDGSLLLGETLSVVSTLADVNTLGTLSYKWFSNDTEIKGATGATYVLTKGDVGKAIKVQVSYNDGLGAVESATSNATDKIQKNQIAPVAGATEGDDKLKGTDSDDLLVGLTGNDTLEGLAGNDSLSGDAGNDLLDGGNGDDTLSGGDGKDALVSGSGNDNLDGGSGNDSLDGGNGNDSLDGGKGSDTMAGGDGDDTYSVDNIDDKIIEGNEVKSGNDTILTTQAKFDLQNFKNVENVVYSGLANFQGVGSEGNNKISGDQGDDSLIGGSGMDTLYGGIGDDTLDGGFGKDSLVGGAGSDTYILNNDGDVIDEKASDTGSDMILTSETFDLSKNPTIEFLKLQGNKEINGTGNSLNNTLEGNESNNELMGDSGEDKLFGYGGNDTLSGGDGDDVLDGGDGVDQAKFDESQNDYQITIDSDGETIQIAYVGNDGAIKDGTDTLKSIEKVAFNDSSFNVVIGTATNDKLASTTEVDKFVGLSGKDTFVFTEKTTSSFDSSKFFDAIQDFNSSDGDKIDLSKFDGNAKLASKQSLKFITGDDFTSAAQVRFDKSNGYLLINTDADTTAEFVIQLNGVNNLSNTDLILA
jgi:Ca2+-binding RTX toxin-like protein